MELRFAVNLLTARKSLSVFLLSALMLLTACSDLTGRGPAPLDKTLLGNNAEHPRAGHVYCMRGWLGIFSTGMDDLARKIDQDLGVAAVSLADEENSRLRDFIVEEAQEHRIGEPLVLVGHSYGADDQIRVSWVLREHEIPVDLLVLFDPVTPPTVPDNVQRVYCIYRSHPLSDWLPVWRGVPVDVADPTKTRLENIDLRTTDLGFDTNVHHVNIEKLAGLHAMALKQISKVCPLRSVWMAQHSPSKTTAAMPVASESPASQGTSN